MRVGAISAFGLVLLSLGGPAFAAISCSATITSMTIVYDPAAATQNITTGSYTVSCTRLLTDPSTFSWQLGVDDGGNFGANSNHVQNGGGQQYAYDTYRLTPYNNQNKWGDTGGGSTNRFSGTINFGAATSGSATGPFDIMMPAGQAVQPAGTYTDTITASLRNGAGTFINSSVFTVTVLTTNTCQISAPPGDINFTYTSFQGSAATASTNFGVRCTTALPYTMALDLTSGTVLNLNYTLALSSASGTGNGATQTYAINGSMAAGQSGTCATAICTGSATRTLTLSW